MKFKAYASLFSLPVTKIVTNKYFFQVLMKMNQNKTFNNSCCY